MHIIIFVTLFQLLHPKILLSLSQTLNNLSANQITVF